MKNYVSLVGNLGNDPELIKTEKTEFLTFSIAQNYTKQNEQFTDWLDIAVFGESKEKFLDLKKGDFVHLEGSIRQIKKQIGEVFIKQVKINAYRVRRIKKGDKVEHIDMPNFEEPKEVPF